MSRQARQGFLAGVHVGVFSVSTGDDRGPWTVPVWYSYEPGSDIRIITGRDSPKVRMVRAAGRCSLCVQSEQVPYRYVTVEGSLVAIDDRVTDDERRSMARRYLGPEGAEAYMAATADLTESEVVVIVRPERWLSADFSGQGS